MKWNLKAECRTKCIIHNFQFNEDYICYLRVNFEHFAKGNMDYNKRRTTTGYDTDMERSILRISLHKQIHSKVNQEWSEGHDHWV